ncbi:MAG TPA: hypothetical protein VJW73_11255 [Gemmatimonadaceae bacterium]|nr:hypothetical protein [Gemmatimonadaceae bacterium]
MSLKVTCCCLAFTIAAVARSLPAQEQNPPTVPTELVQALLGRGEYDTGRAPRLFVGRAPDGFPPSVTSIEGGTVLGGMEEGRNAVVVLAFTLPPNQVVVSVDRQLRARGWNPPPPPIDADRGGFVSSGYGIPFSNAYCADSASLAITSMPAPRGGTYLKITQLRNQQFSVCRPSEQARRFFGSLLKFPSLLPPPGMISHGGGGGSGSNSTSTSARLTGPLKPAELVAHYCAQLDAAGWRTRAPVTAGEDVAVAYVEATDSTRVVWHGLMTALQIGPSEVEVEIKMTRPSDR